MQGELLILCTCLCVDGRTMLQEAETGAVEYLMPRL